MIISWVIIVFEPVFINFVTVIFSFSNSFRNKGHANKACVNSTRLLARGTTRTPILLFIIQCATPRLALAINVWHVFVQTRTAVISTGEAYLINFVIKRDLPLIDKS